MKIFGREPALFIGALVAVVMVIGNLGFAKFTGDNAAALVVVVNAIAALATAWTTRPISLALFTGVFTSVLALGATYGINLPGEVVISINAALYPVLAFLLRDQVSPQETVVSRA